MSRPLIRIIVLSLCVDEGIGAENGLVSSAWAASPITASPFTGAERSHWAYQPIVRPTLPPSQGDAWSSNPVDRFIFTRFAKAGIEPSPEADRRTLIRRLTYDLHGLPPTPTAIAEFVNNPGPGAYEHLVDRLLNSPRYGERWARTWLDLVRYAESDGYKSDKLRPGAWCYRDYVIGAFNEDKPYDRFVQEQLAGDELDPDNLDAQIATGFLRHWPFEDNGRDLDKQWETILSDVTDVTGQVFLGLTVGCARCHDHKYDAIRQRDYYRLQAFFAPMVPRDDLPVGDPAELAQHDAQMQRWRRETEAIRAERDQLERPFVSLARREKGRMFPDFVQQMLRRSGEERTVYERQLLILAGPMLHVDAKATSAQMPDEVRKQWNAINAKLETWDTLRPSPLPTARGVRDVGSEAPPTRIPGHPSPDQAIAPGYLSVLDAEVAEIGTSKSDSPTTGRRTALARWLTDPGNPLTARVIVNRIWQRHFTRGLVETPGDFGTQGQPPSHPRLFDWLASELIARKWSIKEIDRLIVTSSVYRQASGSRSDSSSMVRDSANRWLGRMPRRRLEAEAIRDALLTAAGRLNVEMRGPSVLPELPQGLTGRYGWTPTKEKDQQHRRSIYLVVKRNTHLPLLKSFDVPDNHQSCTRRMTTTTPVQALILLNDDWPLNQARAFASRLLRQANSGPERLIDAAFNIAFARRPSIDEVRTLEKFLNDQSSFASTRLARGQSIALPTRIPPEYDKARAAAWVDLCHSLLNCNEFIYVD